MANDKFPYQLSIWLQDESDLNSVLETLIRYNEPYEIRQNTQENAEKGYWAVWTKGKDIFNEREARKVNHKK